MKKAFLIFLCFILCSFAQAQEQEQEFGFTGEVYEVVYKQLNPEFIKNLKTQKDFPNPLSVTPLMIGFSSLRPDNTDFECFHFVRYYWPGSTSNKYIGFIIVNYGNTNANGTWISVDVSGPKNSKFLIKRTIPSMTVMLYVFTINLASQVGAYEITGTVNSSKIHCAQTKTGFYIEEIW